MSIDIHPASRRGTYGQKVDPPAVTARQDLIILLAVAPKTFTILTGDWSHALVEFVREIFFSLLKIEPECILFH